MTFTLSSIFTETNPKTRVATFDADLHVLRLTQICTFCKNFHGHFKHWSILLLRELYGGNLLKLVVIFLIKLYLLGNLTIAYLPIY